MLIYAQCPACHAPFEEDAPKVCPHCGKNPFPHATEAFTSTQALDQCPVCGSAHLYRQKDFNRAVGIGILILGVVLSFFTYGISLVAVTLLDWFLYRRVGEVGCCYQCHAQFRRSPLVQTLEPFNLSLHDYYKNLRRPTGD